VASRVRKRFVTLFKKQCHEKKVVPFFRGQCGDQKILKKGQQIMIHSPTTVSDTIDEIIRMHEDIENTILIGEKVAMIQEASSVYNQLRNLITDDYLLPEEYSLISKIGSSWQKDIAQYDGQMEQPNEILKELEDQIREALDDFLNGDLKDNE